MSVPLENSYWELTFSLVLKPFTFETEKNYNPFVKKFL